MPYDVRKLFNGDDLLQWEAVCGATTRSTADGLVVAETGDYNWHVIRIHSEDFIYRRVTLKVVVKFHSDQSSCFYAHHFGGIDLAHLSPSGKLECTQYVNNAEVTKLSDLSYELDLEFINCHDSISLGCSKGGTAVYSGSNSDQFTIESVALSIKDATSDFSKVPDSEKVNLIDVGAQGGLQLKWGIQAKKVRPVLFEPIPAEAEKLRRVLDRIPGSAVIEVALSNTSGAHNLYITKASSCSSLREPNPAVCDNYTIGEIFEVIDTREVQCVRYDELFASGNVPVPDVIKIDVQGFEYEVLQGFGGLLSECLAIELETHMYELYRGQKLLGDLVSMLSDYGFTLRKLENVPNFEGDLVEFNAFFMKTNHALERMGETTQKKAEFVREVLGI